MMLADFGFEPHTWSATGQVILKLGVAAVLGAIIGAEREYHGRAAGLRTQLLVALGSCLAMIVSLNFATVFGWESSNTALRVDPARVAYGIMSGIGFLGAGAILRYGTGIRGLTTAASLWCTAAVGLACGFGMFTVSVVTTAIVLFALLVMSRIDHFIPSRKYKTIIVCLPSVPGTVDQLGNILGRYGVRIVDTEVSRDNELNQDRLTLHVSISSRVKKLDFLEWLKAVPNIRQITVR
jgi:putative Mg2+ transporter-C (MgtC) family protein